uniref:Uncharacterized protein n=1 Tax=Octactis speculum TaxID=3111310 RepID=A0A6U3QRH7_9STRA|mmetsp:Transcript_15148/g.20312  ORF Transcript_15148/g.20312 Transcript_15148/m.20312 type:complete len:130 (+) Transcript_15148:33-422(+)|eukprot:CAMPEP_0185769330 /NCGR_PEP_ID=MMETSP1174-20130828/53519_1 /TAXON_ID=35687 /ORGANISM="Dictyocha speculum, Strain CCMP1381" /LENGTH=129 /DNA_ID=CAMNT_0028454345 /DNA_START=32 /DNA_END=421 /DNA_ORIENTATION=+
MFAAVAKRTLRAAIARPPTTQRLTVARSFFNFKDEDRAILGDAEHQGGRRLQEIEDEKLGLVTFNRDPIMPPVGAGTKENPIQVPSGYDERVVGFEDPTVHQLQWFTMTAGKLHYVSSIDKYFTLVPPS